MGKLKLLMTLLMGALLILAAQNMYFVKTYALSEIYSDIVFTGLAVESLQYTRQIEYGVKNGKSLENFYGIQSVLNGARRCSSYINGAFIVSADYTVLYSVLDDDRYGITRIRTDNFEGGEIYAVYDEPSNERFILTLPIYGRDETVCGYMVLSVDRDAVDNRLSDFYSEGLILDSALGSLVFLTGTIFMIHCCRLSERLFRRSLGIISAAVCSFTAIDTAISAYKLRVITDSIIGHSAAEIILSLQNDLDYVRKKGVALGKIYDFNGWLSNSVDRIPYIKNVFYDKNYRIAAVISDDYTATQIWYYANELIRLLLLFAAVGLVVYLTAGAIEKRVRGRKHKNEKEA
ncbi:MAG: cache domain-containing protein [Oscillospiraceae bacterium]|nr:cache domain-containing protein [Oscillospiraceae bacterium]